MANEQFAYAWDNIQDPGPEPSPPGPQPPMANREERNAWIDRTSKYRIWLRDNRRFQLAKGMKTLLHELEDQVTPTPATLVAFYLGSMALAGDFDGNLFGGLF